MDIRVFGKTIIEINEFSSKYPALTGFPDIVYAVGDVSLLEERTFAVVGSRTTPVNALKTGKEIARELSEHFAILTGAADGGDTAAIEGALSGSGKVICLLAGGFSDLPQSQLSLLDKVAARGLLLSAHPFETPVRKFSYEKRNELLAKTAQGVLVLGAGGKSGALITARYAKKEGKKLFAFPYPPNSSSGCGCNRLIKEGAYLTESARDILDAFGIRASEKKALTLNDEERRTLETLRELCDSHVSELAAKTGIPVFKLRGVLSALELKGAVVALGGNRYSIV